MMEEAREKNSPKRTTHLPHVPTTMGFALQISSISEMVSSEEDEQLLLDFLKRNNIQFNDRFDPNNFQDEFFEVEAFEDDDEFSEESAYVSHPEVGWSWWSNVQLLVANLIGEERAEHTLFIRAWYGVAVPSDVSPTLLGEPRLREPQHTKKPTLLQRLGLQKKTPASIDGLMETMVVGYGGDYENLHIVSGPRLLAELEAAIEKAGLQGARAMELYEKVLDHEDDEQWVARCYLVMVHKFLKAGLDHGHLVWWRK